MQTITREKLESMRQNREDLALVNVLSEDEFHKAHIPGSINVPVDTENFTDQVRQRAGGENKPIVVYCASKECDASPRAARALEDAGFKKVMDYEGGLRDWRTGGGDVAGSRPQPEAKQVHAS